jgi:TPR repeat protein
MQPSLRNDEASTAVTLLRRITRSVALALGFALVAFASPAWAKVSCAKTDMKACKSMCAKKDATSCMNLSMLYLDSDDKVARLTMEKACKLKSGEACVYAAAFSDSGRGGEKDSKRAEMWFQTGCKLKNTSACGKLAEMLYEADRKAEAVKWYEAACKLGSLNMCGALGQMEVQGDGIPQNGKRGVARLERVCDAGIGRGCVEAGVAYELGEVDGHKDRASAMPLYKRACSATKPDDRGCTYAARELSDDDVTAPR